MRAFELSLRSIATAAAAVAQQVQKGATHDSTYSTTDCTNGTMMRRKRERERERKE